MNEQQTPLPSEYELVIGLEVHVELLTREKAFCACQNAFGAEPNTLCCPVCSGESGALPRLNRQALELAAVAGMALGCQVHPVSRFDRKHYEYPDLPKGYQITQFFHPLCEHGELLIPTAQGEKRIGIARIHLEEDSGKLIHDPLLGPILDKNRCGIPLMEIVSQPDLHSGQEAVSYLRKLRAILTYAEVSDCKMNEGSLRCDVNLSIRKPGEPLGVRTEIKNLNSFQSVERAIAAEAARQRARREAGLPVLPETLRFDPQTQQTIPMRRKESTEDYRYCPDPDLPEAALTEAELSALRARIPPLPDQRKARLIHAFGLTPYAAEQITQERWLADQFEQAAALSQDPTVLAHLILGEAFALMALRGDGRLPVSPQNLAKLSNLLSQKRINSSTGKALLAILFEADQDPETYATQQDLLMIQDETLLRGAVGAVLAANGPMVAQYLGGKSTVFTALMGKAMAQTRGKADPEKLRQLLLQALEAFKQTQA